MDNILNEKTLCRILQGRLRCSLGDPALYIYEPNKEILEESFDVYDQAYKDAYFKGVYLKDELVPIEHTNELNKRLSAQKGIKVEFQAVSDANHFFSKAESALAKSLDKYIKKETALY